jgi:phenylacetate-CoA ligase
MKDKAQTRLSLKKQIRRRLLSAKYRLVGPRNAALPVAGEPAYTSVELERVNWTRRVNLVKHCAAHVPYYRALFQRIGFHPNDLTNNTVFEQLPILEKDQVREHFQRITTQDASPRLRRLAATGGSTGQPLRVYLDKRFPAYAIASRILHWWGVDPSDNSGYLYRAIPEGARRLLATLAIYPTRRAYIHSADMTLSKMRVFYEQLIRLRVSYLVGYVGAIDTFHQFLVAEHLAIPTLRAVWTTASPLPRFKLKTLDAVYGCPVYTQYGCVEVPFLAAECECRAGLHVFSDIRHIEVIKDSATTTATEGIGDLLVTDLTNYVFPLLRYRAGDRGRLLAHRCKCGRPYPLIDYVLGRTTDNIVLPDGTSIPGEYWTTIFDDWPHAIRAFQVHQNRDYTVEIRIEPAGPFWENAVREVSRSLDIRTQRQLRIEFRRQPVCVNDNGKTRYITSDVTSKTTR